MYTLVRMQNKPCWNSKLMGIHLAHNIRILKIKLKKKILRPDFAPLNLLFFQCPFTVSGRGVPLIMPHPFLSGSKQLRSTAFCWCIVCFCNSNGSFRILKKTWDFFSKWYYFHNLLKEISFKKNISSSFFSIFWQNRC